MSVRIIVVRHGERLDETGGGQEWRAIRTRENANDPPLTAKGWDQAKQAGRQIAVLLQKDESNVTFYSSPTVRTLSTAAGLMASLRLSPEVCKVTPVYSMNCCAAAQRHGVSKGFPAAQPGEDVMRGVPLACWPSVGDPDEIDRRRGPNFVMSVEELAAAHQDGDVIVVVTHREGIWELLRHVGSKQRFNASYCSINLCTYDLRRRSLAQLEWNRTVIDVPSPGDVKRQPSGKQSSADRLSVSPRADPLSGVALSLEAVLSAGSGAVMIHRGSPCGGAASSGTLLWQTPGVRGVWIEGGAVPNGEVVTLLSSPVTSEGSEGDFVLIRRPSGIEGWTKVKNVHLPQVENMKLEV